MKLVRMIQCSMFAAILSICAWLYFPYGGVSFTMQTFGVFLTLGLLGGKYGTISIGIYLLLGSIGIPVFSAFQSGLGVLLGPTGGYLWGFLFSGAIYYALEKTGRGFWVCALVGLLFCYVFGTFWFWVFNGEDTQILPILFQCVIPFIIPDLAKLFLSSLLVKRLNPLFIRP